MSIHRIAICDDNDIERDVLGMMLKNCDSKQMIYNFSCGEELLAFDIPFDLVFLDIYMDGMNGMEVAKALQERNNKIPIIFLTSTSDFAVESYEVQAFDYIVKPLKPDRLKTVWERFLTAVEKKPKYLMINNFGKTEKINYAQIEFLESAAHYVTINLIDGKSIKFLGKLDDIEQQLNDVRFLRCHKSFLINMNYAISMGDDFVMYSGKLVAYRKREKKQLQNQFKDYMIRYQMQVSEKANES